MILTRNHTDFEEFRTRYIEKLRGCRYRGYDLSDADLLSEILDIDVDGSIFISIFEDMNFNDTDIDATIDYIEAAYS